MELQVRGVGTGGRARYCSRTLLRTARLLSVLLLLSFAFLKNFEVSFSLWFVFGCSVKICVLGTLWLRHGNANIVEITWVLFFFSFPLFPFYKLTFPLLQYVGTLNLFGLLIETRLCK